MLISGLPVDYILPRHSKGLAGALLTIYFVLMLCMLGTYGRLLYIITTDPGYLPLGPGAQKHGKKQDRSERRTSEDYGRDYESSAGSVIRDSDVDSPGLELFYTKQVFVCSQDGRPKWCSECANWKPDRTHHCSDVGRCVYKMDHYCPWYVRP